MASPTVSLTFENNDKEKRSSQLVSRRRVESVKEFRKIECGTHARNKKLRACIKVTSYATDDQRERIANRDNSGTKPTVAFSKVPRITLRSRPPSKLIDYNTLAASLFSLPSSVSRSISLSFPLTRYPRGLSRARSLRTLSVPRPHTRSHGEFYIPWVSCWLPSRVGLRFRCSVPLLPLGAVPLASLSLSHSRSFSSLVLRIPFNSLPPRPRTLSPCRTVVYISRGSFAHHRLAAVLASRESEFLPAAPPFLAFSLRPCVPLSLSLSLASFGVSRTPPIYTCIPVHFVSTRSVAHASPLLLPFFPLLSAPSGSARARSRGPFPSRLSISSSPDSRHTRSPRSFCPVPFHHRCRAAVPSLAPFVVPPPARPSPHRGCSPFCIAWLPLAPSFSLTPAPVATPSGSILVPLPLVRPRFLALSDARSSRSRLREAQGEDRGGGVAFTSGSSLGPAPVSCFA